ncbi:hypothetical protein F2Q68_00027283 [Brassica cretica]|uniref:Uncharacterized protein n=1 Tax=Brassica cretica TaxID=69181 RepID=A0A8S9I979_BRACR|nr:hypothetical protein F2Q68_00027283 [Brassica cretica]
MLAMRTATEALMPKSNPNSPSEIQGNPKASLYEQCREERIKENLQRMQNLGILNLARKLQSETRPGKRSLGNSKPAPKSTPPTAPSRRSSRLENTTPVAYNERDNVKGKKSKGESLLIFEGPRAEVYTEEHEKLLGNTERSWTCFVDGYGKDGKRIYDPFKGKTCHQCRELGFASVKTNLLNASAENARSSDTVQCMRLGPRTILWRLFVHEIAKLGYKSVAHYLIQTKQAQSDDATPNQASAKRSLSFQEAKQLPDIAADDDLPNEVPKLQIMGSQNGDSLKKEEDENTADENQNSAKRSLSFCLPSADVQVTSDHPKAHENIEVLNEEAKTVGNSVNTGVRRSERKAALGSAVNTRSKRKAALEEPNPDSIGARLRQRRRSQSGL